MLRRSSLLVVVTAAASGLGLARVARGVGESRASVSAQATFATTSTFAAIVSARDEGEHDEPHAGGASDNPYEEPASPARAGVARVPVVSEGGMLRLPGGRFIMGSLNARSPANERPSRPATVAAFWMDRTEVTVGAYRTCVDAQTCDRPSRSSPNCTYDSGDRELPVSCVHWRDADAYCRFVQKRLPTEAEWEYAAHGTLPVGFPWGGNSSCSNAITLINDQSAKSCAPSPARVGSHPSGASVFGVQDLSGNVEEWTADWYTESVAPGPAPRAGAAHVLRGGGWLSPPSLSRTTARNWGSALESGANVGFRCARDD
ncbi:MAG: SUMF1/EgtB/PvdO family nonheme iron enzyme [Polyangiaceae bacterium]|jgi:formylglycine-generating enzyme required for sulfatase activity